MGTLVIKIRLLLPVGLALNAATVSDLNCIQYYLKRKIHIYFLHFHPNEVIQILYIYSVMVSINTCASAGQR